MKTNILTALAAAALVGSAAIPLAANAQVYGYGPSSVINAWTAGIPLVTYGFGSAYGAPNSANAYYGAGYYDNYYGGYGSPAYYGGYPQYQPYSYGPSTGYLTWMPQTYQNQPYYGGYNQSYMPTHGPVQQTHNQGGYWYGGYIPGVGCTSDYCPR